MVFDDLRGAPEDALRGFDELRDFEPLPDVFFGLPTCSPSLRWGNRITHAIQDQEKLIGICSGADSLSDQLLTGVIRMQPRTIIGEVGLDATK